MFSDDPARLVALHTAILAAVDPTFVEYRTNGQTNHMASWFNQLAEPAFKAYRTDVPTAEICDAWVGTEIDTMSSVNLQRLQLMLATSPSGLHDMSRADRRAGFESPFGGVNAASRVAMRLVWKRAATRAERLFVSGTGSDVAPGIFGWQGQVSGSDISAALNAQ